MKTRKTLVAMLVVALLAGYYLIGTDYLQQRRVKAETATRLTETTAALSLVPIPPPDLEQRLSAAEERREAAKNLLPAMMSSTRIIDTILRLAAASQAKAIPLITQPWTTESLGEYGYAVFRLNVKATGSYNQLMDFLKRLESGEMSTLTIEDVTITGTRQPSEGRFLGLTPVEASLNLAIYTGPPATGAP